MTLTEFLLARIAEDEAHARDGVEDYADMDPQERADFFAADLDAGALWATDRRTLRECEAKRRIVMQCAHFLEGDPMDPVGVEDILGHLASVYVDHPDYDPDWAV